MGAVSDLDALIQERDNLYRRIGQINAEIREKHVSTWQGLAQAGLVIDAIREYRNGFKCETEVPSLMEAKNRIEDFLASLNPSK